MSDACRKDLATGVVEVLNHKLYRARDPSADIATCGACGRSWDDSVVTAWTPTPDARCPFEYEHDEAPTFPASVLHDLHDLLAYAEVGEERDYESQDGERRAHHIFPTIQRLKAWLGRLDGPIATPHDEPRIEVIVVRDPDGDTDIDVFVAGVKANAEEFHIDTGRSPWTRSNWEQHRDRSLAIASPACAEKLGPLFDDPPGGKYIEEDGE
ncbi:hypothetical protein [Nocardia carnea]|uniref:hypothetical protein n=1 Tax=Nocardia carnea TaxID=37328 RepID=UPI0024579370|nr:hypothetical protein [Nocardia carnea]